METVSSGKFAPMWVVHGLASVIGCKMECIYPEYGGQTVRKHHNRIILPRLTRMSEYFFFKRVFTSIISFHIFIE